MENSTKAILIAAAVLIAIVIIALGVMIVKTSRDSAEQAKTVGESIEDTTDKALNKMREQRIARQNGGSLNSGNGGGGSLNPESGGTGGGIGQGNETLLSIITQIKNAAFYCGANTTQAETLLNNPSTIVKDSPNIMTIVFAGGPSNYSPSVLNPDNCALVENPLDFSNVEEIIRHFNNHPTRQFDAFLSYDNSMISGMTIVYYSG